MQIPMTEAQENFAYWVSAYNEDLAKGRDPNEFGMRWMAHQIDKWRAEADVVSSRAPGKSDDR